MPAILSDRLRDGWAGMPPLEVDVFRCEQAAEGYRRTLWPGGKSGHGVFQFGELFFVPYDNPECRRRNALERLEELLQVNSTAISLLAGQPLTGARVRQNQWRTENGQVDCQDPDATQIDNVMDYVWTPTAILWPGVMAWACQIADPAVQLLLQRLPDRWDTAAGESPLLSRSWPCVVTMIADVIEFRIGMGAESRVAPTPPAGQILSHSGGQPLSNVAEGHRGAPGTPFWDADTRTLWFDGQKLQTFAAQIGEATRAILSAFQEENWPEHVLNPTTNRSKAEQAIKTLNAGINKITFHIDGDLIRRKSR